MQRHHKYQKLRKQFWDRGLAHEFGRGKKIRLKSL